MARNRGILGGCFTVMVSALLFIQMGQLTLANSNTASRIRSISQPWPYEETPNDGPTLYRRGGVLSKSSVWPRTNLALDASSCSSYASYMAQVVDNIQSMLGAAISSLGIIKDTLGKARDDQTADERAMMDFFGAMYGELNPGNSADAAILRARAVDVESFAQKLADGLELDTLKTTIFCDDSHLYVAGKDANGDETYGSLGAPTMTIIDDMSGKCAGHPSVLAFMMTTTDNKRDVMTICPRCWTKWGSQQLSQYAAKSLSDLLGKDLNDILNATPEVTLLHEFTHTESFFLSAVMEDRIINKNVAYEYQQCFNLGQSQLTETDLSSVLALSNAETFAYFCAAMYLDMCNWRDGICEDPASV